MPSTGVGEVIARGRNVMAGYWEDEKATADVDPRRLVPHRRSRALRRRAATCTWSGDRRTSSSTPTARTSTPTRSRTCTASALHQGAVGRRRARRHRRTGGLRGRPGSRARSRRCRAAEVQAKVEEHFRKVSADLPIWKRVRGVHFWEGDLPKTAKRSVKRREVAAEIARLRRKNEETKGALAVASGRGRAGRLAARHRRDRLGAPPRRGRSWAAASASWASTA